MAGRQRAWRAEKKWGGAGKDGRGQKRETEGERKNELVGTSQRR